MVLYVHTIHGILYKIKLLRFGIYVIGIQYGFRALIFARFRVRWRSLKPRARHCLSNGDKMKCHIVLQTLVYISLNFAKIAFNIVFIAMKKCLIPIYF